MSDFVFDNFGWVLTGGIVAVLVFAAWADHRACQQSAGFSGTEYQWGVFAGCHFERKGRFIPRDRWFALEGLE